MMFVMYGVSKVHVNNFFPMQSCNTIAPGFKHLISHLALKESDEKTLHPIAGMSNNKKVAM
jgi:hypothetical protein